MPLYFFHLRNSEHLDEDTLGVDLPALADARVEALRALADMLRDAALTGEAVQGEAFEITDPDGQSVLTLRFDDLLDRTRDG